MSEAQIIEFPCLEVTQPIGTFYVGNIAASDLVAIAYADIRRIERREVEEFTGIQRPLNSTRVKELRQYVTTVDASFPTSIILAVRSEDATYDPSRSSMKITRKPATAKIIDGQHRIAGLEGYEGTQFDLNVTIFVDMDIEDQALTFATINLAQTKVNKSLVYDLYEYAASRSPQKTCHSIAKLLNRRDGSPFDGKIKILGRASGNPRETITQATFVDQLIRYISRDPMDDRDRLKRGKKISEVDGTAGRRLIFRRLFIEERDAEIAKILWNYFAAVEKRWPEAWPMKVDGNILNRTTGFIALMRFLHDAYLSFGRPDSVVTQASFKSILDDVNLSDDDFTPDRFNPGGSGTADLYNELCRAISAHVGS